MESKPYIYYLGHGIFPLDWEVCFLEIEEYKAKLAEKYQKQKTYCDHVVGGLDVLYQKIDDMLEFALADFKREFSGYGDALRCLPMVFPLPCGDSSHAAAFAIILKRDEDGDTVVYSPYPLPHLEAN